MARKPRIHYWGALYHVIVRGNNQEKIMHSETQKNKYLEILTTYKEQLGFILYAYCIMDNHAHLLIEVRDIPLSRIMQRIQQVYTQWYNRKYNRTGHVFQQRYKALLCDKERYFSQLIKYIHHNPVKGNLDGGINYKWSSHNSYISKKGFLLVDTSYLLDMLSHNRREALTKYFHLMNQKPVEISYESFGEHQNPEMSAAKKYESSEKRLNVEEIIERICMNENFSVNEITRKTKTRNISDIRKAIVLLSERYCNYTNVELAEKLNLSPSMISKIKSGTCKGTSYVKSVIRRWEESR